MQAARRASCKRLRVQGPEAQSKAAGALKAVSFSQQSMSASLQAKHAPLKSNDIFGDLMGLQSGL
jgi:hypothetical protein